MSQNFSENWKMRKSKISFEKFWEIFPPGVTAAIHFNINPEMHDNTNSIRFYTSRYYDVVTFNQLL